MLTRPAPTTADGPDFIGVYQQDRYSDGGARGLGTSVSTDGGASFSILPRDELPDFTQCVGNRLYERASDPWVSFGPKGDAHQISLSFNNTANLDNAVLVSKLPAVSDQHGALRSLLKRDTNPAVFNDKGPLPPIRTMRITSTRFGIGWCFLMSARTASRT